jgi:murein DD-endopeptidase MepM/ murein hydrolase activator NlpD
MHCRIRHAVGVAASALALTAFAPIVDKASAVDADPLWSRIRMAAAHEGLGTSATDELVRVLAESLDLARPTQHNDRLVLLLDASAPVETVVALSFIASDADLRYYRFATASGGGEFYDAMGRSAARAPSRKPLDPKEGTLEQKFGWRTAGGRMHTGVDWTAPRGTPVLAPADGTVAEVERHDTGIRFLLRHGDGYESAFSYLAAIAVDERIGAPVRKGERIGTVGWNGAAGPVLHYEVLVNGRLVDPLRTRLPSLRRLEGQSLGAFHEERERLDRLMTSAATYDLFRMK